MWQGETRMLMSVWRVLFVVNHGLSTVVACSSWPSLLFGPSWLQHQRDAGQHGEPASRASSTRPCPWVALIASSETSPSLTTTPWSSRPCLHLQVPGAQVRAVPAPGHAPHSWMSFRVCDGAIPGSKCLNPWPLLLPAQCLYWKVHLCLGFLMYSACRYFLSFWHLGVQDSSSSAQLPVIPCRMAKMSGWWGRNSIVILSNLMFQSSNLMEHPTVDFWFLLPWLDLSPPQLVGILQRCSYNTSYWIW